MDNLSKFPSVVQDRILNFLNAEDILNCSLVCRSFKSEVDHLLKTVTHIRINEENWFQTFIPFVIVKQKNPALVITDKNIVSLSLTCENQNLDALFSFLKKKCPHLQVLSAFNETVTLGQLLKISTNLVYFQVQGVTETEEIGPYELRNFFPSLRALVLRQEVPHAFCASSWTSIGPDASVTKFTQASNVRCHHQDHRKIVKNEIPPGIEWYFAPQNVTTVLANKLAEPVISDSLKVLHLNIQIDFPCDFKFRNLIYVKLIFTNCETSKILNQLKYSPNLLALYLEFKEETDLETKHITSLSHSLQQLKYLCISNHVELSRIQLSLPPQLTYLFIQRFSLIELTDSAVDFSSLKFLSLGVKQSILHFRFPNLIECKLVFEHSDPKVIKGTLESLDHSKNLKQLHIEFYSACEFYTAISFDRKALKSLFGKFKLESFEFITNERLPPLPPSFNFKVSSFPNLRLFKWKDQQGEGENSDSVNESICFTIKPPEKYPIKFIIRSKYYSEFSNNLFDEKVTKATFQVSSQLYSFEALHLIECKIILFESSVKIIQGVVESLCKSQKLEVITLITKPNARLDLSQFNFLKEILLTFDHLKQVKGTIYLEEHAGPLDLSFELSNLLPIQME